MHAAGVEHVPEPAPEPWSQLSLWHCELLLQVPPSAFVEMHVGVCELVSQNVFASKQRPMHAWPVVGALVHFIACVSHG